MCAIPGVSSAQKDFGAMSGVLWIPRVPIDQRCPPLKNYFCSFYPMPPKEDPIKSLLPYDTSRGGQVIEQIDLSIINSNRKSKLFNYASSKMEDIKKQYEDTIALWKWNEFVDSFNIGFEPVVGKIYYMYDTHSKFISILSPNEFKKECVGITKLNTDGYWEKLSP
jgi:hypothetical protein